MKIIFFGTSNVALPVLEALKKQHEVLAVVTTPDVKVGRKQLTRESPVAALAKDLSLKTFKPEKVKNNQELPAELRNLGADIFVVVAYGKILPPQIINLPKFKTVNVHFSVLPKYRGPSPIQFALLNGDAQTGTSIFLLDEKVDDGPLLSQEITGIDSDDNFFTLSDKLARLSAKIINEVLNDYANGKITPLPQDDSAASYSKIIAKQDGQINWQKTAAEIYNQFRAFYIWPGIWTTWQGKKIQILDCLPTDETALSDPGTIMPGGKVSSGNSTIIQIKTLKLEGKNEMAINDFLNGYRDFVGSHLG